MILGMDEWTNSDTDTEKENEPAKNLNQVAAPAVQYGTLCIVYWVC